MIQNRTLRRERVFRILSLAAALILGALIILTIDNLLLSSVLAFVITYLCKPLVTNLERLNVKRALSISIIFLVFGVVLTIAIAVLSPILSRQASLLQYDLPRYVGGLTGIIEDAEAYILQQFPLLEIDLSSQSRQFIEKWVSSSVIEIPRIASKILSTTVLAPFIAFFLLKDGRSLYKSILSMVPNNLFEIALGLGHKINDQIGGFIRARLLEAAIVGGVVWLGLSIINFPYATLIALFAALTNLIPYVGPFIGAVPAFVIAFINQDSGLEMVAMGTVFLIAQLIDIVFIIPLVVARIVNLHPMSVVITLIIGWQLMGVLGMIISIPITSTLKLTFTTIYDHIVDFRA